MRNRIITCNGTRITRLQFRQDAANLHFSAESKATLSALSSASGLLVGSKVYRYTVGSPDVRDAKTHCFVSSSPSPLSAPVASKTLSPLALVPGLLVPASVVLVGSFLPLVLVFCVLVVCLLVASLTAETLNPASIMKAPKYRLSSNYGHVLYEETLDSALSLVALFKADGYSMTLETV